MSFFANKAGGDNYRNIKVTNNISSIPFDELGENCRVDRDNASLAIESFADTYGLKHKPWLYPQMLAKMGNWTLSRNENGLFSGRKMLIENCQNDMTNLGYYFLAMSDQRFLPSGQYKPETAPYCALVPLLLAAHKRMSGIKYSEWDKSELTLVINKLLYNAITTVPPAYTVDELLQFRVKGLTIKSGDKMGRVKSAVSTYSLNGLDWAHNESVGMGQLPQLLRMMLCQTWCAHPSNRHTNMILDPLDWDKMPDALITDDPIVQGPKNTVSTGMIKLPWDE